MIGELSVQRFTSDSKDLPQVVEIYRAYLGRDRATASRFVERYFAAERSLGLLAKVGDQVVGMCFGAKLGMEDWWFRRVVIHFPQSSHLVESSWSLAELGVRRDHRRQGIGSALMRRLIGLVEEPSLILSTDAANEGARAFYERFGFVALGETRFVLGGRKSVVYRFAARESGEKARESD